MPRRLLVFYAHAVIPNEVRDLSAVCEAVIPNEVRDLSAVCEALFPGEFRKLPSCHFITSNGKSFSFF
jgi:hypothetical protein